MLKLGMSHSMVEAMVARHAFPIVARERGGDGRKLPHLQITCSDCGTQDFSVLSTGISPPPAMSNGVFRKRGWSVGHRRSNDLCPACNPRFGKLKSHAPAQESQPMPAPTPAPKPPETPSTLVAAPPPQPTRYDKRRVLDALDESYEPEVGYRGSATDSSIARKLDVPRVWVSSLREDFFGPETSEYVLTIRNDVQMLIERGAKLEKQGLELAAEGEALKRDAERIAASFNPSSR